MPKTLISVALIFTAFTFVLALHVFGQTLLLGDLNGDNKVNIDDLRIFISDLTTQNARSDIDKNGKVDIFDLSYLVNDFGGSQPVASGSSLPTSFGANIVTATFDATVRSQIQSAGVTSSTLWIYLPNFLDASGNVKTAQLVNTVNQFSSQKGNLNVTMHIMPQTNAEATQKKGFYMPADLISYQKQVQQIASALKGKIKYYSISNEVPATWIDTQANYLQLLSVSKQGIKMSDPQAVVLDSGMSSVTFGVILAYEKFQVNPQDAYNFLTGYFSQHSEGILANVHSVADLSSFFANPVLQNFISFGNAEFSQTGFCPAFDTFQIHFYQEWQYLPNVIDWAKEQMQKNNCQKPIQIWELGYGLDSGKPYDVNYHAQSVPKYLTIAASSSQLINYVTFYTKPGFAKELFTTPGQDYPPGVSFRTTVQKLTGASFVQVLSLPAGVWGYQFTKNGKPIYVLWSGTSATVSLNLNRNVTVTDINGNTRSSNSDNVTTSSSPVFVE